MVWRLSSDSLPPLPASLNQFVLPALLRFQQLQPSQGTLVFPPSDCSSSLLPAASRTGRGQKQKEAGPQQRLEAVERRVTRVPRTELPVMESAVQGLREAN